MQNLCVKTNKAIVSPFYRRSRRYNSLHVDPSRKSSSIQMLQNLNKDWQHLRKNVLTASTFGGAVGFWQGRRVQLWEEKIGAREPFSGDIATAWSNINEKDALIRYEVVTGNKVFYPKFQVQENWLGASADGAVDYFVNDDMTSRVVLEIKCPYFGGDKEKSFPWKRVPLYYIPQAQGLMEIHNRDTMHMFCWTLNGTSLFRLHRDAEYWKILKMALSDFWWNDVYPAKRLYDQRGSGVELKELMPAPKHELHQRIARMSKSIVDNSELLFREIRKTERLIVF